MLPQYKKTTNIGIGLGFVAQILVPLLAKSGSETIASIVLLAAIAVIAPCKFELKEKMFGYSSPKTKGEKFVWFAMLIAIIAFLLYVAVHNLL